MNNIIFEHPIIFNKRGQTTRGTLCAVKDGDEIWMGSSICSKKDQFRKDMGRILATKRAEEGKVQSEFHRHGYNRSVLKDFETRTLRYFKDTPYSKVRYVFQY